MNPQTRGARRPASPGLILIAALLWSTSAFASARALKTLTVSPSSFNPTAGMSVDVHVDVASAGRLTMQVVDRDGFVVRTLATDAVAGKGLNRYVWDGRSDGGGVVADEAYSLRAVWSNGRNREVYFPAQTPAAMEPVPVRYYSQASGVIAYDLARPSRVHLQVGVAAWDERTKSVQGPVLKTVVNREPRAAGAIAEQWNGLDESGAVFVPDLPDLVMTIATTALPENAIIAIGNRKHSFLEQVAGRRGKSLLEAHRGDHAHHAGLTALDDVSPPLKIEPLNAKWSEPEKAWMLTSAGPLRLKISVTGPAAAVFAAQPGTLFRFANARLVGTAAVQQASPHRASPVVEIPAAELSRAVNLVSINWQSRYGGVAANTLRVRAASAAVAQPREKTTR